MKPIKNELSKSLKGNKYYNPNTFNAIDGLLAYFTVLIAFFAVGKLLQPCVNYIVDKRINGVYIEGITFSAKKSHLFYLEKSYSNG